MYKENNEDEGTDRLIQAMLEEERRGEYQPEPITSFKIAETYA